MLVGRPLRRARQRLPQSRWQKSSVGSGEKLPRLGWLALTPGMLGVSGCRAGAPSLSLFGAYFPAWLACLLFAVAVALGARVALIASGATANIPMQLAVCVSAGVCGGVLLSWLWVGI